MYHFLRVYKQAPEVPRVMWTQVKEGLSAAACIGPLLEVDLADGWAPLVRMEDGTPTGFGMVGRYSSVVEIREGMQSGQEAIWQREAQAELLREEMEDPLRSPEEKWDKALVARNPGVRRGKGMLEVFAMEGGRTAAARAQDAWWSEAVGNGIGKQGNLQKKPLREWLLSRIRRGVFTSGSTMRPRTDGVLSRQTSW